MFSDPVVSVDGVCWWLCEAREFQEFRLWRVEAALHCVDPRQEISRHRLFSTPRQARGGDADTRTVRRRNDGLEYAVFTIYK